MADRKGEISFCVLCARDKEDALESARTALVTADQVVIDGMAERLIEVVKARNSTIQLSKSGALEVLAKIGIMYNKREPKK